MHYFFHQGMSIMQNAMAVVEVARVDASLSTFFTIHSSLAMLTIALLVGSGCSVSLDETSAHWQDAITVLPFDLGEDALKHGTWNLCFVADCW